MIFYLIAIRNTALLNLEQQQLAMSKNIYFSSLFSQLSIFFIATLLTGTATAINQLQVHRFGLVQAWATYGPRGGPAPEGILTGPQTVSNHTL